METENKFQLEIYQNENREQVIPLSYGKYIIGRAGECDILLTEKNISRHHTQLEIRSDDCFLMDLGSFNGTQIEGKPITPRKPFPLALGQIFTVAQYQFVVKAYQQEKDIYPSVITEIKEGTVAQANASTRDEERAGSKASLLLRISDAHEFEQTYLLTDGEWLLGRGEDCSIRVDDGVISRHHANLNVTSGQLSLSDLGSRNGIHYKGELIPSHQTKNLQHGDVFSIANLTFTLELTSQGSVEEGKALRPKSSYSILPLPKPRATPQESLSKPLNLMGLEKVTIGRAADNHIVINHPLISHYHAILERLGTRFRILDLKSHNGTFVNSKRIEGIAWLKEGDRIKIGVEQFILTGNELNQSTPEGYTIEVNNLNKWVTKDLNLLKNISLNIGQNEFVALVGMSGAGKTTLQDAINGFRPATDGEVMVNSVNLYENYDMFRNDIGYVPQRDIVHMELTPNMALDYAAQLRMPQDMTKEERQEAIDETLENLGLSFRKDILNARLSGGQLKRVSIGVELLTKPKLFFLDEPTSGLDPGTEYEMMKLLRRLADQGRTIMLITHATKNVMLCDKVIILARGGYMAFFGAPEDSLVYFDKHRTERERMEKEMEFDDIYRILNDDSKGSPEEWHSRFQQESAQAKPLPVRKDSARKQQPTTAIQKSSQKRASSLRQFFILSSRNTRILFQDKVSLGLMLGLAPLLGFMNFIWGQNLFDPVKGDSPKTMAMWFMSAIIGILVGSLSSVREIVKEADIFKRERAVGLQIFPYALSKLWVGVALAIYSGIIILLCVIVLVKPSIPNVSAFFAMMLTLIITITVSYLLGLLISAAVPNQNASLIVLIAVIVPQLLFAGVLLPLEKIPFRLGEPISYAISSRWSFESFVRASGVFEPLTKDKCWVELPKEQRLTLSDKQKELCSCMGARLFDVEKCGKIPGIKSPDFYDEKAQIALAEKEPYKPIKPTAIPSPTPIPTPTPYPTPTEISKTEEDGKPVDDYIGLVSEQNKEYGDERSDQFENFRQVMKEQGSTYADESREQFEIYGDDMESYGNKKADWEKERESAIAAAESTLNIVYDDYGRAFKGEVTTRWLVLAIQGGVMFALILFFQKRKDVV